MIRTNGYYISLLNEYIDSRFKSPLIGLAAYYFINEEQVIVNTKQEYLNEITDFVFDDFQNDRNQIRSYMSQNNTLVIKPVSKFGRDTLIKIEDSNTLFNLNTGSKMYFVSWSELDDLYNEYQKKSNCIIQRLFELHI